MQVGKKFGLFNLNTRNLSAIKYDNSGGWLNDGYSYHEGGSFRANSAIYSQLGMKSVAEKYLKQQNYPDKVVIRTNSTGKKYLANSKGKKKSSFYDDIEKMQQFHNPLYFEAFDKTRKVNIVLNEGGVEIGELGSSDYTKHYIELVGNRFYFTANTSIVQVPAQYKLAISLFAKEGFLVFKSKEDNSRYFIDRYGNHISEAQLKSG